MFTTKFQGCTLDHFPEPETENYLAINTQFRLSPCPSFRHWQPCPPFRLHSTYTRPPYPGATPSPPSSFNHLRAFSLPRSPRSHGDQGYNPEILSHLSLPRSTWSHCRYGFGKATVVIFKPCSGPEWPQEGTAMPRAGGCDTHMHAH